MCCPIEKTYSSRWPRSTGWGSSVRKGGPAPSGLPRTPSTSDRSTLPPEPAVMAEAFHGIAAGKKTTHSLLGVRVWISQEAVARPFSEENHLGAVDRWDRERAGDGEST